MNKSLDLHFFDEATQVTTLNAPGNDLSAEMKTYYEKRLLDAAEPELVHDQFADKYPIPQGSGKTIEFRKYSALPKSLTALTEGTTPPGSKLNVSAVTATVSQYGDWIGMSDMLDALLLGTFSMGTLVGGLIVAVGMVLNTRAEAKGAKLLGDAHQS